MTEEELDSMLAEIGGPCNVENMIKCFESKMAGEVNDADETIITAIKCHDEESKGLHCSTDVTVYVLYSLKVFFEYRAV